MHSAIYFGFMWLFLATVVLEINHQLPDNLKFLHGGIYEGYAFAADFAGVVFAVGIVWAIGRRYIQRPYRIRIKTKPEDAVILFTFLVITVTGFCTEAFRIALVGRPGFEKWSFVGYPLSSVFDGWSASGLQSAHRWLWGVHFRRVRRVPRDPAHDEASPHDHVADEHVPARSRPPEGRDEANAQSHGDRARHLRRLHHRGLHLEAAVRHRRVHGVRPAAHQCAPRTRLASCSTRARSCSR